MCISQILVVLALLDICSSIRSRLGLKQTNERTNLSQYAVGSEVSQLTQPEQLEYCDDVAGAMDRVSDKLPSCKCRFKQHVVWCDTYQLSEHRYFDIKEIFARDLSRCHQTPFCAAAMLEKPSIPYDINTQHIFDINGFAMDAGVYHAYAHITVESDGQQSVLTVQMKPQITISRTRVVAGQSLDFDGQFLVFRMDLFGGQSVSLVHGEPLTSERWAIRQNLRVDDFFVRLQNELEAFSPPKSFASTWNVTTFNCQHFLESIVAAATTLNDAAEFYGKVFLQDARKFVKDKNSRKIMNGLVKVVGDLKRGAIAPLNGTQDWDSVYEVVGQSPLSPRDPRNLEKVREESLCKKDAFVKEVAIIWKRTPTGEMVSSPQAQQRDHERRYWSLYGESLKLLRRIVDFRS